MDLKIEYQYILEALEDKYGIKATELAPSVFEFKEGPIQLFQLIYGTGENPTRDKILVSMHLDLDSVDAIQWYMRIREIHPYLYLAPSHYKDDFGETYMGPAAEAVRMHKLEQKIISGWQLDKEKTKKFLESKISGRARPDRSKGYLVKEDAEKEFFKMQKEDKDKCH